MSVPGLPFFEDFLGLANAAGAGITATVDSLAESYGARDRMSPAVLQSNADAARSCAQACRRAWDDEAAARDQLSSAWFGEAADAARSATDARLADASRLIDALESAASSMAECASALTVIGIESDSTATQFDLPMVGGRTVDEARDIAASAEQGDEESARWLAEVLVPIVQQSAVVFGDLCDLTESAMQSALGEMRNLIDTYSIRIDTADDGHLQIAVTETASGAEKFVMGMGEMSTAASEPGPEAEPPREPEPKIEPEPPREPEPQAEPEPVLEGAAEPEPTSQPEPEFISQPAPRAEPLLEEAGSL